MIAKTTDNYVVAFMLTYVLVMEQDGLDQIQKISFQKEGFRGVFQSGSVGVDPNEMILSFYDPLQKTSRVYFTKLVAAT